MEFYSYSLQIQKLQATLVDKCNTHFPAIQTIWNSLNKHKRKSCIKDVWPEHVDDLKPEWNIDDFTEPSVNYLLDTLKHRVTTSLMQQYRQGPNGSPGDYQAICTKWLYEPGLYLDEWSYYFTEEAYGEKIMISSRCKSAVLDEFYVEFEAGLLVERSIAERILSRQLAFMKHLIIIVDVILDRFPYAQEPHHSSNEATALEPTASLTLQDAINKARERKWTYAEYLSLIRAKPDILCEDVKDQHQSRPELVPRRNPEVKVSGPGASIGLDVFDVIHQKLDSLVIWHSIKHLLELLADSSSFHEYYRDLIIHEIYTLCCGEFYHKQRLLARHISTGIAWEWLRRSYNGYGDIFYHKTRHPGELIRTDRHLHYLLRFLHREVDVIAAIEWLEKIGKLWQEHPEELQRLSEREVRAFSELAAIVQFVDDISSIITPVHPSRTKGHLFEDAWEMFADDFDKVRNTVGKLKFEETVDGTLQSDKARSALKGLDKFVRKKMGERMGFVFDEVSRMMFRNLEDKYERWKHRNILHYHVQAHRPYPRKSLPKSLKQLSLEDRARRGNQNAWHLHSIYSITPKPRSSAAD